ncbi:MAG TPA: general secretion pathway protein GspK, partial [Kineobactrum sp.]
TQKIGDWLDEDNATRADGAEDDYYLAQTPAYRAANRPMTSASELRTVATVTPELYRALAPLVTVWPQTPSSLNIHTAPLSVLRSINADDNLAPLTQAEGIALYERQRSGDGFLDMDDFFADPIFAEKAVAGIRSLLDENSSWFLLSAEVEVADRNMRLYSVLQRDRRTIRALVRANGSR